MGAAPTLELTDRVVVVTGGSRGIGAALSRSIRAAGAHLVILARDADRLEGFVDELDAEPGGQVLGIPTEITDDGSVAESFAQVLVRFGRIDGLVNNAGVSKVGPSLDYDLADWRRIIDTNVTGLFACTQLAARAMATQGGGTIVNTASLSSFVGQPERAAYVASKTAVLGMTKALAVEWGPLGIRINAVAPGYIATDLTKDLLDRGVISRELIEQRTPLRRFGEPEDLAAAVLYLLGDASAFVTGTTISVDGGWLANGYMK